MKNNLKKYLLWIIIAAVCLILFAGAIALFFALKDDVQLEGKGTKDSPYLISDKTELYRFADWANASSNGLKGKYFLLASDIDLNGESWNPVATVGNGFSGNFDGNGKTVSNFKLNADVEYAGFFAKISNQSGGVSNLSLSGVSVESSAEIRCLGLIAGYSEAAISNCSAEGNFDLSGNTAHVGGIVGNTSAAVRSCTASGTMRVKAMERIAGQNSDYEWATYAGIAGSSTSDMADCVNNMEIIMTKTQSENSTNRNIHTGGICGAAAGESYSGCINNASLVCVGAVGGIIGTLNNEKTVVSSCKNYGSLTSQSDILCDIGGVVSRSYTSGSGLPEIKACYSTGDISLTSGLKQNADGGVTVPVCWAGGILACGNVNVTACAADCNITVSGSGTHYVGGVAGGITGTLCDSYHTGDIKVTSESSIIAGGVAGVLQDIGYYGGDKTKVNIAILRCYNSGKVVIRLSEQTLIPTANYLSGGVVGFNMNEENSIQYSYFDVDKCGMVEEGFVCCKYWYGEEVPGMAENINSESIFSNAGLTTGDFADALPEGFKDEASGGVWVKSQTYPRLNWQN